MLSAYGKDDFYNIPPWKNTTSSEFDISNVTKLPRVDIVFADADMSPDLIDASVAPVPRASSSLALATAT